ncbi:hypothetical protein [uncultured Roseobacter sp.]|uniref:hypothetical protein n=1 Tax=uncultured Roseobacter sp. TaxID=114847 RepID=UPI00260BC08B|nr:hypothetical protein [uncultured Roseobacter sp.]
MSILREFPAGSQHLVIDPPTKGDNDERLCKVGFLPEADIDLRCSLASQRTIVSFNTGQSTGTNLHDTDLEDQI